MTEYVSDSVHWNTKRKLLHDLDVAIKDRSILCDVYELQELLCDKIDSIRLAHIYNNLNGISNYLESIRNRDMEFGGKHTNGKREGYNYHIYRTFIGIIKEWFYKVYINRDYEIDKNTENLDVNKNILTIPFALTYINIYFELIYSDIKDFYKYCKDNENKIFASKYQQLSKEGIEMFENMQQYLLDRYQNKEIITQALDKYVADNKIFQKGENGFHKAVLRKLRGEGAQQLFPYQSNADCHYRNLRNLSSHGDFTPYVKNDKIVVDAKDAKNKDTTITYSIEDIIELASKLELNMNPAYISDLKDKIGPKKQEFSYEFLSSFRKLKEIDQNCVTLTFLKKNLQNFKSGKSQITDCGFKEEVVLHKLILLAYYTFFQYNTEQYFHENNLINDSQDKDWIHFDDIGILKENGHAISRHNYDSLVYSQLESFKHAFGHFDIEASSSGLFGKNDRRNTIFYLSILNAIELITQPSFYYLMTEVPHVRTPSPYVFSILIKERLKKTNTYLQDCKNALEEMLNCILGEKENTEDKQYVSGMRI